MEQDAQLADKILAYIRAQTGNNGIDYAEPLTRLVGGFQTTTCRFRLSGASDLSQPLVLRYYSSFANADMVGYESFCQNVLSKTGQPVAPVRFTCLDTGVAGAFFYIMDFLSGSHLEMDPPELAFDILGRTHANLHNTDITPIVAALQKRGMTEQQYGLDRLFGFFAMQGPNAQWLRRAIDWCVANRPPGDETSVICHCDFHPLNLLFQNGEVTGIVDWTGFMIGDAALDIAVTMISVGLIGPHLADETIASGIDASFLKDNSAKAVDHYLSAYAAARDVDLTHFDYYRVTRSVACLLISTVGFEVFQRPAIAGAFASVIEEVSGVSIKPPGV